MRQQLVDTKILGHREHSNFWKLVILY
jgi:hypothetical protein